ncbi:MAG: glycosyltransferase family 4 protein [Bacteroidota bacterium]
MKHNRTINKSPGHNTRIVIVNQYFHPDQTALSQIITDLSVGLSEREYEVEIICSKHAQVDTPEALHPIDPRITVCSVGGTRFGKSTMAGRLIDYISFYFFAALSAWRIHNVSLIMTTTAPPLIGLVGVLIKKIHHCKFVYNIQDLYPHTAIALGVLKNKPLIGALNYLLCTILRHADQIIAIGEDMADKVNTIYPNNKTSVIHNWADGGKIFPVALHNNAFIQKYSLHNKFIILYSGNFGLAHDFTGFLEAAYKLLSYPEIVFLFVGDGGRKSYIEKTVHDRKLSNVIIQYYEPASMLSHSLSSGHIGLISLFAGLEGCIVPSKVYSLMAAGQSIIYSGGEKSTVAAIINEAHCGYRVNPDNSDEVVRYILEQYHDRKLNAALKENARFYFEQHFDREIALEKYDSTFQLVLTKENTWDTN